MQHTIVKLELEAKQAVVDMEKKYVNLTLDGKKVREARTVMPDALSVWCAASSVCQHDRQLPDSFSQNKKHESQIGIGELYNQLYVNDPPIR